MQKWGKRAKAGQIERFRLLRQNIVIKNILISWLLVKARNRARSNVLVLNFEIES